MNHSMTCPTGVIPFQSPPSLSRVEYRQRSHEGKCLNFQFQGKKSFLKDRISSSNQAKHCYPPISSAQHLNPLFVSKIDQIRWPTLVVMITPCLSSDGLTLGKTWPRDPTQLAIDWLPAGLVREMQCNERSWLTNS